ncbi:MAG: hypothetical protein U1E18_10240, partial [Brevundimonas sp.]|uniref:hypothetical protein n=1 Tax=Brevundimonas sp. TaxID=1871086 RepID=UPI002ABA1F40
VIWTGSANSHTGQQRFAVAQQAGQMAASDYVSDNPKFTLALKGASTEGKRTFANGARSSHRIVGK